MYIVIFIIPRNIEILIPKLIPFVCNNFFGIFYKAMILSKIKHFSFCINSLGKAVNTLFSDKLFL